MNDFDREVFNVGSRPAPKDFDEDVFSVRTKPLRFEQPKQAREAAWTDAPNAVGTGFWRGATRLAGLPVDTAANVIDLVKAGAGTAYGAATGRTPPAWTEPMDRRQVVGSGDYLLDRMRQTGAGRAMVDPQNPDFEGGHLQNIGGAFNGIVNPNSRLELAKQGALALTAATGGKVAADSTGNPAFAITAGLLPQAGLQGLTEATKLATRGGSAISVDRDMAARQAMAQRVADLHAGGITNPTLGLATGNRLIGGAENLLSSTPGAMDVMARSRQRAVDQLRGTIDNAADMSSRNRGDFAAGQQIQRGIEDFKDNRFKPTQQGLYDRLSDFIPNGAPMQVPNTRGALETLNADIPGAPNLSQFFKNGKMQSLEGALNRDLGQERVFTPSQLRAASGQAGNGREFNAALNEHTLPFQAVKQTRTLVGNEIADNSLLSDVPRSKWRPLYGALTEDMRTGATQSGPDALGAFNRADRYTRAGVDRL